MNLYSILKVDLRSVYLALFEYLIKVFWALKTVVEKRNSHLTFQL